MRVSEDAPVCEAFAREGWCEKEAGTCEEMHVWECGEWRDKGTCSRGATCGLRHVLRVEKGKASVEEADAVGLEEYQEMSGKIVRVEGGFDDGAEFIELGIGYPPDVESEETDQESGAESSNSEESGDEVTSGSQGDEEEATGTSRLPPPHVPTQLGCADSDEVDEDQVLDVVF